MKKFIIVQGLPGSGKTTWAKDQIRLAAERAGAEPGRSENFRPQTELFLQKNGAPDGPLFMRAVGDSRIDWLVKGELFERYVRGRWDVQFVLDDRDQVVKFWRGIGLPTWQVAPGDF